MLSMEHFGRTLTRAALVAALAFPGTVKAADIVINEFMAANSRTLTNAVSGYSDWIELYNTTPDTVSLTDWSLTDTPSNLRKWIFPPASIAGYSYLLVFADSSTTSVFETEYHCSFGLDKNGEYLALVGPATNVVHQYSPSFPEQTLDVSYGLKPGLTSTTHIAADTACKYLVPSNSLAETNWNDMIDYDDSWWPEGQVGIGYETGTTDFGSLLFTVVPVGTTGIYVRAVTDLGSGFEASGMALKVKYDDGFILYLNGSRILSASAPDEPGWGSLAVAERLNADAIEFREYDLSAYTNLLTQGPNLFAFHVMNFSTGQADSDMLFSAELSVETYSQGVGNEERYFHEPTPGMRNILGELDYISAVVFDPPHGFFEQPVAVSLSNAVAGTQIRYTLDCSTPGPTNGTVYTNPVTVNPTAVIRARAYKTGYDPSPLCASTYISPAASILQSTNTPPGYPPVWSNMYAGRQTRYGMNQSVIAQCRDVLTNALLCIPSVSLTTDKGYLFNPTNGIYMQAIREGIAWERPASLEWINPDGTGGFMENCGIRMAGNVSRQLPKKSFRVLFKSVYGTSKLSYPVFEDPGAVDSFDGLIIGSKGNADIFNSAVAHIPQYTKDRFVLTTELEMGYHVAHYRMVHLYLNGMYWGMYTVLERQDQSFMASYEGGTPEDWDVMNMGVPLGEGDDASYRSMWNLCDAGMTNNVQYQFLQGNDPDGTRNPAYDDLMDIQAYIDYLLVQFWMLNADWPTRNHIEACGRGFYRNGFRYLPWDSDYSMAIPNDGISGVNTGAAFPYGKLNKNEEFLLAFADRAYKHLGRSDGALSASTTASRWSELTEDIALPLRAECARWGESSGMYSLQSWEDRRSYYMNTYCPQRTPHLLYKDLRNNGARKLYPSFDPPVLSPDGGVFTNGQRLTMTTTNAIYYTLNGGDPREYGTSLPAGILYTNSLLLSGPTHVRARARCIVGGSNVWSALAEGVFSPDSQSAIRITELMYHPAPPTNGPFTASDFEFIELSNSGASPFSLDQCFFAKGITFTFTNITLAPGAIIVLAANTAAFTTRYSSVGITIAGQYAGQFADPGERVTLMAGSNDVTLIDFEYSDNRGWSADCRSDGAGHSLVPTTFASHSNGVLNCGANWRSSTYIGGSPGAIDPAPVRNVLLNEFMAHTDITNGPPGYDSNDWIEMFNTYSSNINLGGWFLSDDPDNLRLWPIPATNVINAASFRTFDEISGFHSPITNGFGLDKSGERIFLSHLPGGGFDRVADCIQFKGQENSITAGRYPDGSDDWYMLVPTTNASNLAPSKHIIINEVMYNPPDLVDDSSMLEYVELYNPLAVPVQLWNVDGTWRVGGGIEYLFPTNTAIGVGQYLVIVPFNPSWRLDLLAQFQSAYGLTNGQARIIGPYAGRLSNGGNRVALERPLAPDLPSENMSWVVVDEVYYGDRSPWPPEPDGQGRTLQRVNQSAPGNAPDGWTGVFNPSPGMPQAKIGLTSPQNGAVYVLPESILVRTEIDAGQVSGSVHHVEFMDGTNSLGTDNSEPYEFGYTITNVGNFNLWARVVDDSGTNSSGQASVKTMKVSNQDVSDLTDTSATLGGIVEGSDTVWATIYWGTADGGTDTTAWANSLFIGTRSAGSFESTLSSLAANTTYRYRCYAQNAADEGWADQTLSFTTMSISEWSNRLSITFSGYTRADPLDNFPALVVLGTNIQGFSYSDFASTNGNDLRFTDSARTRTLNYEIARWNTNGLSYVWVQVPRLSSGGSYILAYWNNPTVLDAPFYATDGSTWGTTYRGAWHFETSGLNDSSPFSIISSDSGTATGAGIAGQCRSFDGVNDIIVPSTAIEWYQVSLSALTISMWARPSMSRTGTVFGANTTEIGRGKNAFHMMQKNNLWEYGVRTRVNTQFTCTTGQWQMLSLVLEGTNATAFFNGQPGSQKMDFDALYNIEFEPSIGHLNGTNSGVYAFSGLIDEPTISPAIRSSNWLWACWMNVASNTPFITYGTVTTNGAVTDSDFDGMMDDWELLYFGGLDIPDCGPAEDRDSDGSPNLDEFLAGTNPTNGTDFLSIEIARSNNHFVVRYVTVPASGIGYTDRERRYDLEDGTNLAANTWSGVTGQTNLFADGSPISFTNLPQDSRHFFRVKARLQ